MLGRKRFTKPVVQITVHISEGAYEFLEEYRVQYLHEPKYVTLDRMITEYKQQKGIITSLRNDIEEKDVIIQDLRDTSTRQWNKLQQMATNV